MIVSRLVLALSGSALLMSSFGAAAALAHQHDRSAAVRRRLQMVQGQVEPSTSLMSGSATTRLVAGLGTLLARSGILPARTLAELEATLSSAALGGKNGLALFIGSKVLLALGALLVAVVAESRFALPTNLRYALPAASLVIGLVLPDHVIKRLRQRYLRAVSAGIADALDMMVICSEAGLGLEPAIERVGEELEQAHPQTAKELRATAHELQIMSDRRQALANMGERTQLDSLRRLGTTLIQTMQFGTPLTQALRTLAAEMRQENMTLCEARAAKLPVMLTFPMILFILPCVFIVVGGPAILRVAGLFGKH